MISADLPGSGRSLPLPRLYSPSCYHEDAEALHALIHGLTDRPSHLVGFSDGGEVALLIAARHPNLVRSVLVCGAVGVIADTLGTVLDTLADIVDHPVPPFQDWGPHLVAAYGEQTARDMMHNVTAAWKAIVAAGGDISRSMADKIECPVLLITGAQDNLSPASLAKEFAAAARNATAVEAPNPGHDVYNARPDWFIQTVFDWVSKNATGPAQ